MAYQLPVPSLQQIACMKVGALLLNQRFEHNCAKRTEAMPHEFMRWGRLKGSFSKVFDNIRFPKVLKSGLWDAVVHLYNQLLEWLDYFNCSMMASSWPYQKKIMYSELLIFTSHGMMDKRKMFQNYFERLLIEHSGGDVDLCPMFLKACDLCLEDSIKLIWAQMSKKQRLKIIAKNTGSSLVSYWLYYIEGSPYNELICKSSSWYRPEISFNENYFSYALEQHNGIAIEYFWFKLSEEEKKRKACGCVKFAVMHKITDLVCSSLNYLSHQDYVSILDQYSLDVLYCLLDLPYEEFFFHTLAKLWPRIDGIAYIRLLSLLLERLSSEFRGVHRSKILIKFWVTSPRPLKQLVMSDPEMSFITYSQLDLLKLTLPPEKFKCICSMMIGESEFAEVNLKHLILESTSFYFSR